MNQETSGVGYFFFFLAGLFFSLLWVGFLHHQDSGILVYPAWPVFSTGLDGFQMVWGRYAQVVNHSGLASFSQHLMRNRAKNLHFLAWLFSIHWSVHFTVEAAFLFTPSAVFELVSCHWPQENTWLPVYRKRKWFIEKVKYRTFTRFFGENFCRKVCQRGRKSKMVLLLSSHFLFLGTSSVVKAKIAARKKKKPILGPILAVVLGKILTFFLISRLLFLWKNFSL